MLAGIFTSSLLCISAISAACGFTANSGFLHLRVPWVAQHQNRGIGSTPTDVEDFAEGERSEYRSSAVEHRPTRHFARQSSPKVGDQGSPRPFRIVLLSGFETFNRKLYRCAADRAVAALPGELEIYVCTGGSGARMEERFQGIQRLVDGSHLLSCSPSFDIIRS